MPPTLPRKRIRTPSPQPSVPPKRSTLSRKAKPDVFSAFDSSSKNTPSTAENRAFLDALEDDQSSLSEADSDDFEDVLPTSPPKRQKTAHHAPRHGDSDEDLEFEDVADGQEEELAVPEITEHFEVTIRAPGEGEPTRLTLKQGGKASITKKMRRARVLAHCMHVQLLLWHNIIRNLWINDAEVHSMLSRGLPDALKAEVSRCKLAMGYEKPGKKGKGKNAVKSSRERIRDWGADAEKSKQHVQGDPLIRLLKYLAAYWKKRFVVTAPSLRKLGYRNPRDMRQEMDSFNDGPHDPERHGERVADLDDFRACAKKCKGSRDIGAQLFTALLRGLGIEARLVASLQPTGYGWSKSEEVHPRKDASTATTDVGATDSDAPKSAPKKKAKKNTPHGSSKGTSIRPINLVSDGSSLSSSLSSENEGVKISAPPSASRPTEKRFDRDLLYPTYWTEVLSPLSNTYIPISTMVHPNVITTTEHIGNFEPRGAAAEKAKQVMCYVLAFSADGTAKDVTVRYLRKRQWPGKTKGFRMPVEKLPVYNCNGKIARYEEYDWFKRVMRGYARPGDKRTLADVIEDEGDLIPLQPEGEDKRNAEPDTLQAYKQSPDYVLERHLRREEALLPSAKAVKYFHTGKGDKATKEPVYKRTDVVVAKTVETWHNVGRQVKVGEQALKQVPYRAVTLLRKREIEDQTRDMDGKKPTQGLYAEYQTEWILPDPIGADRAIPKNVFGNIDMYVPSMAPQGAIHIPLKGTASVCKRLGIDFAEACTGFEFGKQRAVPVLTGVVVAEENEDLVIDAWEEDERIKKEKEDKKREQQVLKLWKTFLRGMRVRARIHREYGRLEDDNAGEEESQQWAGKGKGAFGLGRADKDEVEAGGFLREDDEVQAAGFLRDGGEHGARTETTGAGVGFLLQSEDEGEDGNERGGLEIVGGSQDPKKQKGRSHGRIDASADAQRHYLPTPISLQAMHAKQLESFEQEGDLPDDVPESWVDDGDIRDVADEFSPSSDGDRGDSDDFELRPAERKRKSKSGLANKRRRKTKSVPVNNMPVTTASSRKPRRSAKHAASMSSPYFGH